MKYTGKIATLLFGAAVLTGCCDFLDQTPGTSYDPKEVYSSVEKTEARVVSMYGKLTGDMYSTWIPILFGSNSDVELIDGIGTTAMDTGERGTFNYFTGRASQWDTNGKLYAALYDEIGECNDIIEGITNSPIADDPKMDQYLGEAYVIRAQMYMELTRIWGDVPLMLETAKSDLTNVYKSKADRDYILDIVLSDIEKAIPKLEGSNNPSTKVTKYYAEALYAQIALQRCGYAIREAERNFPYTGQTEYEDELNGVTYPYEDAINSTNPKQKISDPIYPTLRPAKEVREVIYKKAIAMAYDVIKNGNYSLNPSYDQFWTDVNLRKDNISENIFEIPTTQGETSELGYTVGFRLNWDEQQKTDNYGMRNSSGKLKLVAPLLYSYPENDQRRDVTCCLFELRDSVLEYTDDAGNIQTIHTARENYLGDAPFGIYVGKWDARKLFKNDASWLAQNKGSEGKTLYGIRPIRMRYSQVLLYYAELYNELNNMGVSLSDYSYDALWAINQVHKRATGAEISAGSYEEIFNAIDNENKWEFAGEGFRKWDLVRWNLLTYKTLKMKLDYLKQLKTTYLNSLACDIEYYPSGVPQHQQATQYYNFDWSGESSAGKSVNFDKGFGTTFEAFEKNKQNIQAGKAWSVIKQADTNLPTISNGLVGLVPEPVETETALDDRIKELNNLIADMMQIKPNGTNVLNRYIMPLTSIIYDNSNQILKNSYGF